MKSIFTNNDLKDMVKSIFAENDENVLFIDGEKQAEKSLLNYLNIEFYAWKDRVVENTEVDTNSFSPYNAWLESLNFSLNKSYALVQITNEEASITQDIDSSKIFAQIHFLVQSDKVSNLDYLIGKIRAKYIANPQKIQNCYGDELMGYFNFGNLYSAFLGVLGLKISAYLQPFLNKVINRLTGRVDAPSCNESSENLNKEVTL